MSKSKAKPYLITYDISDKRRLQRVHRLLKSQAIAMQYSVFISVMNKAEWYAWGDALWPDGMTISGVALPDHYH